MARQRRSFIDEKTHRARAEMPEMSTAQKVGAGFAAAGTFTGGALLLKHALSDPSAPAPVNNQPGNAAGAGPAPVPEDVAREVIATLLGKNLSELGGRLLDTRITIDGVGISVGSDFLWTAARKYDRGRGRARRDGARRYARGNPPHKGYAPGIVDYFVGLNDCVYAAPQVPLGTLSASSDTLRFARTALSTCCLAWVARVNSRVAMGRS